MSKDKVEAPKEKKMLVGVVWNCAEVKFLLTALLLLFSAATFFQFFSSRPSLSPLSLSLCLSSNSTSTTSTAVSTTIPTTPNFTVILTPTPSSSVTTLGNGVLKRFFQPHGWAARLFIQMGAYRGGLDTFAVVGLSSKPLHVYGKPLFTCQWLGSNSSATATSPARRILPDWGYGRVYAVVVLNCTFSSPVGADTSGGQLLIRASPSPSATPLQFTALVEPPGALDASAFSSPPKYDYLYCGSSLYGNLSPQRMREWIAYHARLFGPRSHFVIHDAGGVHREVMDVLRPWIDIGYVTLHDIRDQEVFDGYYHNQFLVVNDCLHRYRFMAKWMFFFDVDEYIYLPTKSTIKSLLDSMSEFSQFTIEQMPMSSKLCRASDRGRNYRMWGFEKLVYKDVKRGIRRDRKYAIQPRNVYATGVHMSQNVIGKTTHKTENRIKYFHYHGTIAQRREPCREFVNITNLTYDNLPYVLDDTLRGTAALVKRFELKTIGPGLQHTRQ